MESDYETLNTRLMNKLVDISPWFDAPLITSRNCVREYYNNLKIVDSAIRNKKSIIICNSVDTQIDQSSGKKGANKPIGRNIKVEVDKLNEAKTGYLPSELKLVESCRYTLTVNINTRLGLVNGADIELVSISYKQSDIIQHTNNFEFVIKSQPEYLLIRLCKTPYNNKECFTHLAHNIIPIFPETKSFYVHSSSMKKVRVKRSQFSLTLPLTAFKAQGKTMSKVIIDLAEPTSGTLPANYAYTALSRATSLNSIVILRPFRIHVIKQQPHPDLLDELRRLELIETSSIAMLHLEEPIIQ
jgi:hypothetical protein